MLFPLLASMLVRIATAQHSADPATPQQLARKLLDSSAEMISAASPQVQASALLDLGRVTAGLDPTQSVVYLEQAFALTATLPESKEASVRSHYQALIVAAMAAVNPVEAMQAIRRMVEPAGDHTSRSEAVHKVVIALLARNDLEHALQTIALTPDSVEYPFQSAQSAFEKLPRQDPRRITLFGNATQSYTRRPGETFAPMVRAHWRDVPVEMARTAVDLIVNRILEDRTPPSTLTFTETAEGTELRPPLVREFVQIWEALQALDPKRAKEIIAARPELAKAVRTTPPTAVLPEAKAESSEASPEEDDAITPLSFLNGFVTATDRGAFFERWNKAAGKSEELLKLAAKNPQEALDRSAAVEIPTLRAELIARIAAIHAKAQSVEAATHTLAKASALVAELKEPGDRIGARIAIAEAARRLNASKQALDTLADAFSDVEQIYRQDTDPKQPNRAVREFWPSIQSCRILAWSAAAALGGPAQSLLPAITSPDLTVIAHIAMAAGLTGQRLKVDKVLSAR